MLKNPYGKNWEVSSSYTIYCVAMHAKNTIYCDMPVCNSLKISRERSRIGSNPITRTIKMRGIFKNPSHFLLLKIIWDNFGTNNRHFQDVYA